ncbi:Uncharacterized protein APZ42_032130, partial [Daphnia magna]
IRIIFRDQVTLFSIRLHFVKNFASTILLQPLYRIAFVFCDLNQDKRPPCEVIEVWLESLTLHIAEGAAIPQVFLIDIYTYTGTYFLANVWRVEEKFISFFPALRCRKNKHYACLARLTMSGERFFMKGHHSHANEENEIARIAVENDCKRRAAEQPVRPRMISEQTRQEHPNAVIGFGSNLERAIQRARRRLQPVIPHSFDEAERTITGSDMYRKTLNQSADFFHGRVSTDTGNAFIFISLALLPEIRTTREIRSDGTFKTVPNLFYELFTLHVLAYGKSFPVAYVLMSNKTAELYRIAIDRILQILQEVNPGNHFEVEVLISDFKLAIMGTKQQAFPNARSRGCWFHYAQAIYRRACKELQRAYRSVGVIRSIVKKLIALTLLPSNRAYEGFQTIRHRTENALLAENPQSRAGVAR